MVLLEAHIPIAPFGLGREDTVVETRLEIRDQQATPTLRFTVRTSWFLFFRTSESIEVGTYGVDTTTNGLHKQIFDLSNAMW